MLEPRWRKVLRDVWLHKARMLLVVPAIAAGLIGAGSVLNTWALVERATRLGFQTSNPASATLYTDSIDDALLAAVRVLPEIADAQARRTVRAAIRTPMASAGALLFTTDDLTGIRIGRVRPEGGGWPPEDGALVVERSSMNFGGVAVGDAVTVAVGERPAVTLSVTGIARDVGVAPGWMEHVVYGFVTRGTLERLGAPTSLDELRIVVRDRSLDQAAVRRIAHDVRRLVEGTGRRVTDVDVPVPGEHIHAGQMNSLLYTQGAFGVLALLLSGFLVVNLIAAMLVGQVREIGVMKTIGARPAQLAGMYLALALALGLAACAVALPAAAVIGRRYGAFKAELLNFTVQGYAIPSWVVVLQALVGIVLPVLAAAIPVTRGCRVTVAEALRDFGLRERAGAGDVLTRVRGITRPFLLSLRNAFRRRQRMVLTLLTLATGGAAYLGAGNLRASIRRGVERAYTPQRYDFVVRLSEAHDADSVEATVAAVSGVSGVEAWSGARAAVVHADGTPGNTFPVAGPPVVTRLLALPLTDGRWPRADEGNTLVVSGGLVRDEGLAVGSEVTLVIGGRETRWTVVGVSGVRLSFAAAYASREAVAALVANGSGLASSAVVATDESGLASQLELIQRVRGELGRAGMEVVATSRVEEARRVAEDHLLTVASFLGVMGWVIIVVGGLGLASTMGLAVLERTREIGVLRAIGARHRSILAIVLAEGLTIGVLSWLVALPLALPVSVALEWMFGRTMLAVPLTYIPEADGVLGWLGLVLVVSVVATAWPALRAMRVTTAAALAYE
jgi:putative ABC transport system permease protein